MDDIQLTGRISPDRIRAQRLPPLPDGVVDSLKKIGGLTSAVADALDALGVAGVVGAKQLRGSIKGASMVGRALTMRNVARTGSPFELARGGENLMGELEAHNLAEPGDVIVIQGISGGSNMGGIAARIGKRRGGAGAVISGGVRDIADSRSIDYPIWASEFTPLTGKWRLETAEINGALEIHGVEVRAGDLVVADECGVCFVPAGLAAHVLALTLKKEAAERAAIACIEGGASVVELASLARR